MSFLLLACELETGADAGQKNDNADALFAKDPEAVFRNPGTQAFAGLDENLGHDVALEVSISLEESHFRAPQSASTDGGAFSNGVELRWRPEGARDIANGTPVPFRWQCQRFGYGKSKQDCSSSATTVFLRDYTLEGEGDSNWSITSRTVPIWMDGTFEIQGRAGGPLEPGLDGTSCKQTDDGWSQSKFVELNYLTQCEDVFPSEVMAELASRLQTAFPQATDDGAVASRTGYAFLPTGLEGSTTQDLIDRADKPFVNIETLSAQYDLRHVARCVASAYARNARPLRGGVRDMLEPTLLTVLESGTGPGDDPTLNFHEDRGTFLQFTLSTGKTTEICTEGFVKISEIGDSYSCPQSKVARGNPNELAIFGGARHPFFKPHRGVSEANRRQIAGVFRNRTQPETSR